MGKLAENNEEDDEAWNPRISLVCVHYLISKKGDKEGRRCNNDDAGPAWHIAINSIEKLGTNNDIDCGPAKTGDDIKYGNFGELDAGNGTPFESTH